MPAADLRLVHALPLRGLLPGACTATAMMADPLVARNRCRPLISAALELMIAVTEKKPPRASSWGS